VILYFKLLIAAGMTDMYPLYTQLFSVEMGVLFFAQADLKV
jgi:hypothetical protein